MISMNEYAERRRKVMNQMGPLGVMVIASATEVHRNGDAVYAYRQHSDFYYLTGFDEPEAVLVLAPGREAGEFILFNRVRDRDHEIWDGPRAGQAGAREQYRADEAHPIAEFEAALPALLAGRETLHYTLGLQDDLDEKVMNAISGLRARVRTGVQAPFSITDVAPIVHECRLIKSEAEIAVMQKAVNITKDAHLAAMRACKPGCYEYQLEAEIQYAFLRQGARFAAYNSIVGAGRHTCILHYVANQAEIKSGDLVLIDAGAEFQNYAADITRTFPANGKFTPEQLAIYNLVLSAQCAAIDSIKPGARWTDAQTIVVKCLTQGLIDLGILKGECEALIEQGAYLPYYMHRSGHWLGLDVHDVGRYKINDVWRPLEAGMVLTVEPGLYLSADIPNLDPKWHNIGVRIEDDVLVTPTGHRVLSAEIPKTASAIEALMQS